MGKKHIIMSTINYNDFFNEDSQKYWGEEGAGCIFVAKDTGRILLAHRSEDVDEGQSWGTWGGKVDGNETPKETVAREVEEETGYNGVFKVSLLYTYRDGNFKYHNFLVVVPFEFTPQLNWEHDNSTWVKYGEWPEPLHFGLQELIKHAGTKLKKVIDLLNKTRDTIKEMDTPPPMIQSTNSFSKEFVDYMKSVENLRKSGFYGGKWHPHTSVEGGLPTIAYGHKIKNKAELVKLQKGISSSAGDRMFMADLEKAKKIVYRDIKSMFGIQIQLSQKQEEILVDYAFTNGSLNGFPKFVSAILNKDWEGASKEYKRSVGGKELGRNQIFFDRYLKDINESATNLESNIVVEPKGLINVGIYGYKWSTPQSFLSFGYDPAMSKFYLYMIQTPKPNDRNKGYSKLLLDKFFQTIKSKHGALEVESYTTSGMAFSKHVIERLAKQYRIQIV